MAQVEQGADERKQRDALREPRRSDRDKSGRRKFLTELFGLAAGVLAIVSIVLGYFLADRSDTVTTLNQTVNNNEGLIERLESEVTDKDAELEEQDKDLADKDQTIAKLEGRIRQLGGEPVPEGDDAIVRNTGSISLASDGLTADLNAQDPRWGAVAFGTGEYREDTVSYYDGDLSFAYINIAKPESEANYQTCSTLTAYKSEAVQSATANEIGPTGLCLQLDSGRYSALKVQESTPERVKLHLTTWEVE